MNYVNTNARHNAMSLFGSIGRTRGMPTFAPDEGGASGNTDPAADPAADPGADTNTDPASGAKPGAEPGKPGPSPEEAKLLKELMKHKAEKQALAEKLKQFDGVDMDRVKQLVADAETAEKARQTAEEEKLRAAGEWDKLKERIASEHRSEMDKMRAKLTGEMTETANQNAKLQTTIKELTVGSAFASSAFIKDETILTSTKARKFYEDHFDVEDGKVVPYDAPRGGDRTPLVNGRGEPLSFDEAMKRIVEADPDRDELLRSKRKPGSSTGGREVDAPGEQRETKIEGGLSRIAAGLASGGLKTVTSGLKR